ncbi:SIR2 family protein [Frigoriglobus tundricola]|nr:SIR2 family protein [Frigoriglobus tundricola]
MPRRAETDRVLRVLVAARNDGRPIIPLVGGGVSAESGLPTSPGLTQYLGAFHLYVRRKVFLPPALRPDGSRPGWVPKPLADALKQYADNRLSAFVHDHNWIDPHQLTDELWAWLRHSEPQRSAPLQPGLLDRRINEELDLLARDHYPHRVDALAAGQGDDWNPAPGTLWRATGDWKDLLRRLTGFERDHAEQLFTRLHRFARPALGHRVLGFLIRVLGAGQVLTVNIDSLLEQALAAEGIGYRPFTLEEGRLYPSPRQLTDAIGVIKLHGGTDRLLLDERLDQPVEDETLRRFHNAFPSDGLLMVVGCGGRDRRVLDLIERGVLAREGNHDTADRVVWLHHEDPAPRPVDEFSRRHPGRVLTAGITSAGLFLRHLYGALTGRHAASPSAYSVQSEGPALFDVDTQLPLVFRDDETEHADDVLLYNNEVETFFLFDNRDRQRTVAAPTASERLAQWMNRLCARDGLTPIWIDLEGQYTLPGVVGAVIDQCRRYDPELTPAVLPLDSHVWTNASPDLEKAVNRVAEALRRGRYFVALDGFELFPWPQTYHHGAPQDARGDEVAAANTSALALFVQQLVRCVGGLGSSRIGLAVNAGRTRVRGGKTQNSGGRTAEVLARTVTEIRNQLCGPVTGLRIPPLGLPDFSTAVRSDERLAGILQPVPEGAARALSGPDADLKAQLALFAICCFRRTRSLVGLHAILGPLLRGRVCRDDRPGNGPAAEVDAFLDRLTEPECRYLMAVEGGLYWMNRELRNEVYDTHSRLAYTTEIHKAIRDKRVETGTLAQLLLLCLHQNAIARNYYFDTFIPSRDPHAFFEYVYHRVSSIRYLTKAVLVFGRLATTPTELAAPDQWKEVYTALSDALRLGAKGGLDEYHLEAGDVFPGSKAPPAFAVTDSPPFFEAIKESLQQRRVQEIRSFRLAWSLADRELLGQVPAEQLISWCDWLIRDDLRRFTTAFWARPDRDSVKPQSDDLKILCTELDQDISPLLADLRRDLYFLWAQCLRERTDLAGCIEVSLRHLHDEVNPEPHYPPGDLLRKVAALRLGQRDAGGNVSTHRLSIDELRQAKGVVESLSAGRGSGVEPSPPPRQIEADAFPKVPRTNIRSDEPNTKRFEDTKRYEAILRCLSDIAACQSIDPPRGAQQETTAQRDAAENILRALSAMADKALRLNATVALADSLLNRPTDPTGERYREVCGLARLGLWAARGENRRDRSSGPHTPYFHFRSLLMSVTGNAQWLADRSDDGFRNAYNSFELARGSLDAAPDRIVLAGIEMRAVRCALAHADKYIRGSSWADGTGVEAALRQAEAKHVVASGYLRRAFDHLLRARRNVVWWKQYFRLFAEYKAAKNAWRVVHLATGPKVLPARSVAPAFLRTTRHALVAVGHVRDLDLSSDRAPRSWQVDILGRLYDTSRRFLRVMAVDAPASEQPRSGVFEECWDWLMESAGIAHEDREEFLNRVREGCGTDAPEDDPVRIWGALIPPS